VSCKVLGRAILVAATALLVGGCGGTAAPTASPSASPMAVVSAAASSAQPSPTALASPTAAPSTAIASPSGSPAGGPPTLVMQSPIDGGMGIYLVDASGAVGLKVSAGQKSARHPDWSPDGKTVAFDSDDDGALWVVNVDGSNAHQLLTCDTGCYALAHPAFSPDGKRIAYVRYTPTTGADPNNSPPAGSSIRVLDLATGKSTVVAEAKQPELVDVPRWSPDGKRLVFAVDHFGPDLGETGSTIAIVDASGGRATRLLPLSSWAYAPDWNRATGALLFSVEEKDYSTIPQNDQAYDLWSIAPSGGTPTQLTHLAAGSHLVYPAWSPDGSVIVASLDAPTSPRAVVLVDPATGTMTQLLTINSLHAHLRP